MHILLLISACSITTRSHPEDLRQSLDSQNLRARIQPQLARLVLDAFGVDFGDAVSIIHVNFLPGKHRVLHSPDPGQQWANPSSSPSKGQNSLETVYN